LGELTLQALTSENVFFQSEVYGRENYPDEYSTGVNEPGGHIRPDPRPSQPQAGYTIANITEAGTLDGLKNLNYTGRTPSAYIQLNPSFLVERPSMMPVNIDVRDNTTLLAQFTDTATATHLLQYRVNIYIEYEEV
jgi:hypothetical protein